MSTDIKTLTKMMSPHDEDCALVTELVQDFTNMESGRAKWEAERRELLNYIDATDTRTTTNDKLPFKNSTTINKIAQLHQNISTSYIEHLMPNRDWVGFEAATSDDDTKEKRMAAINYVRGKAEASNIEGVLERLASDYTDSGIAIAHTHHVKEMSVDVEGMAIPHYTGTIVERIDPYDFYYDVTASTLNRARKCIRSLYTIGSLKKEILESTSPLMSLEQFDELIKNRRSIRSTIGDGYSGRRKFESLGKQGFGDVLNYINEGLVEVLRFFGDFYDEGTDELLDNYEIVVVDRKFIGRKESLSTWDDSQNLHASVWEFRKDSLAPMGPLNRIVGLQYKLDKRENFKEDLHDKFTSPTTVKIGDIREKGVKGGPNHEYTVEEGGDVKYLLPPSDVLRGDDQLPTILALMEDLAGAPKESIGQRTPGEKTKFEVQLLDQGQNKLFRRKVKKFERELLSPVLQDYLEQGRHHLDAADTIKSFDSELGMAEFTNITAQDLNSNGRMIARGATAFAEKANTLQNIIGLMNGGNVAQILLPHMSRTKLFRAVEELADITKYDLFTFGVGLQDDAKLQRMAAKVEDSTQASALTQENAGGPTDDTGL